MRRSIAKNAAVLMGTQVVTWGLSLILTIFLPRYLGPTLVGKYQFAQSMWAILNIFASFGMDTLLTREIARRPERLPEMLWNSILIRIGLFGVGVIGLLVFLKIGNYPGDTRLVVYVAGFGALIWLIIGAFQSALYGIERMEIPSFANIVGKAVNAVASVGALLSGFGVVVVTGIGALAAAVNLLIQGKRLGKIMPFPFRLKLSEVKLLLRLGAPLLLSGTFLVLYQQMDTVIISLLVNEKTIGWYGSADQLFSTLLFVPTVLMTAAFPALARLYTSDTKSMSEVTRLSFDILAVLSIPVGTGLFVMGPATVRLLFGPAFTPSGAILSLFGIVLILTYINVFLGNTLISMDRHNQWTVVMAVATLMTIPLDLWLIPWAFRTYGNGGIGGALSFIVTEGFMLVVGFVLMPKGILHRSSAWLAARAVFAGVVMAAAVWNFRDLFILIPILIGVLVYGALAWMLHLLPIQEMIPILAAARNLLRPAPEG